MKTVGEDVIVRRAESALAGEPPEIVACPNCGSEHVERYCASCGQKAGSLRTPISAVVQDVLDGIFSFDSRIWRTVITLFRHPGSLTVDYWEGRRARFVAPLRLYLFVSFVTFLFVATVAPDFLFQTSTARPQMVTEVLEREGIEPDDSYIIMIARRFVWRVPRDGVLGQTMQLLDGQEIEDRERLQTLIIGRLAWTVFALVPIFAALLRLLYRRRERYFAPHLVFALHFHTLGFLLLGVGIGLDTLFGVRPYLSNLTFLAVALMLFPSLRRVYMEGRFRTIGKQVVLLLAYGVAVVVGLSALMAITALAA